MALRDAAADLKERPDGEGEEEEEFEFARVVVVVVVIEEVVEGLGIRDVRSDSTRMSNERTGFRLISSL